MAKTTFSDGITEVEATWLNKVFGLDGHDHLGEDRDGSAPQIDMNELSPALQALLNDLIAIKPIVSQLIYEGLNRAHLFGGSGKDGAYTGSFPLNNPIYEFSSINIPNGTNPTVDRGFVRIKCTGDCTIAGDIVGKAINQYGLGDAWYSTSGEIYNPAAQMFGSGGSEAVDHTDLSGLRVLRDNSGKGGCGIIFEVLGNLIVQGNIICNGADGKDSTILSGTGHIVGGSGAGSGGFICLQSYKSVQLIGKMKVNGGKGGNGYGTNAAGGGGGAGGWARAIAPIINGTIGGNIEAVGGSPGTSNGVGSNLGGGGGSFGGKGGNSKAAGNTGIAELITSNNYSWM